MSFEKAMLLGAIAGGTIFLGLPLGRLRGLSARARAAAAIFAAGILTFLLVEVAGHAMETVEEALTAAHDGAGSWGRFVGFAAMLVIGLAAGLLSLGAIEGRWLRRPPPAAGGSDASALASPALAGVAGAVPSPLRLATIIAAAIGLHNFSAGLAIGVAAQSGEVALATVLIVGFALHNATEGFAIVGPLDSRIRPSWGWLGAMGLLAGGPTVLGTAIGYSVDSEALSLAFLALAAGGILYVVLEIWAGARRKVSPVVATGAVAAGFLVAWASELVVAYAGV